MRRYSAYSAQTHSTMQREQPAVVLLWRGCGIDLRHLAPVVPHRQLELVGRQIERLGESLVQRRALRREEDRYRLGHEEAADGGGLLVHELDVKRGRALGAVRRRGRRRGR